LLSAARPEGINGVFVEYDGRRWFSSGPAVRLDATRFTRIGDYRGFAVYAEREAASPGPLATIYISVAKSATGLIAPYSQRTH
jgi:hypothetical protein